MALLTLLLCMPRWLRETVSQAIIALLFVCFDYFVSSHVVQSLVEVLVIFDAISWTSIALFVGCKEHGILCTITIAAI